MRLPADERMDALTQAILRLLRRMEEVERRLEHVETSLGTSRAVPPEPAPAAEPASAEERPVVEEAPEPAVAGPVAATAPSTEGLETRFGLTLINRVGAVTLTLGAAFFFKYAVDNQWIGERGRILLGILAGLLALGLGHLFSKRGHRVYAQGLSGAGIAILYLSFYAAFGFYRLISQPLAFLLMVSTTLMAGAIALFYQSRAVLVLGLIGGYATPLLLNTGEDRPWFFLGYVLLLSAGAVAVSKSRKWRGIEALAFLATATLFGFWLEDRFSAEKRFVATVYTVAYYLLFSMVSGRLILAAAQFLAAGALYAIWTPDTSYLIAALGLSAAGFVVAERRERAYLSLMSFAGFWMWYAAWRGEAQAPVETGAVFVLLTIAFLLHFAWLPWRVLACRAEPGKAEMLLAALSGTVYFAASYLILDGSSWRGLLAAALGVLHLALGLRLRSMAGASGVTGLLCAGLGLGFLTLAIPIQFAGYRITMAWAVEAAALAWIGVRGRERRLLYASMGVFALTGARLLFVDAGLYPNAAAYQSFANLRFLTFATVSASLFLTARWMRSGPYALASYIAGHAVTLWALGLEVFGWAARNAAPENLESLRSASLSILLALYALALITAGVLARTRINRILGLGLLAAVVLKLYLYDVWLLRRIYRVTAFAVLGVLLLLTSYLYSRYRSTIETWWRDGKDAT
jgi:uncharacterized membrane protein